jgi:hypothetical protein
MSLTVPELISATFPENNHAFIPVQARFRPNLLFITDYPKWGNLHLKASYIVHDNQEQGHAVELINDKWYFLVWSVKNNSYYTSAAKLVDQMIWKLPFWQPTNTFHPINQGQYLGYHVPIKKESPPSGETTVQLPDKPLPVPTRSSITEPTPTLPLATIAQLTDQLGDMPVFADIVEVPDYEPAQPKQDYLPTTLPEPVRRTMVNPDDDLLAMKARELTLNPLAQGPDPLVPPPFHHLPDPPQVATTD